MNFNKHFNLKDKHAFLGASKYTWLNYDAEKLKESYISNQARYRGTRLHELASELINLGVKLPSTHKTLNMFVNDAIGYRMESEQVLYYSDNCFGTADAIGYKERTKKLRIHDLKTGTTPASMKQLYIYTALFCLEYAIDPHQLDIELRIYQFDDVQIENPETTDILLIMQKICDFDRLIETMKEEDATWN
jgi:hypothetical protein